LPTDIAWYPVLIYDKDFGHRSLRLENAWGMEIALVTRLVDGSGWCSTVGRYNTDWNKRPSVRTKRHDKAMYWAERWALGNMASIRAAAAARAPALRPLSGEG
ncbi:MAG TPA: hypothetical protein VGD21_12450, partial [Lysobacter sp.]